MIKYTYLFYVVLFLSCLTLHAQDTLTVKGTVVDFFTSQPIPNASISVKGSLGLSSSASAAGEFEIIVNSLNSVILISYPGYQTKNYPLFGKQTVEVNLVPEGIDVGESTVRLPYYTANEKDLNGSYRVIANSYDQNAQNRNIYQLLQGTIPGLASRAISGVPGEGASFSLGGIRSLYTQNQPLLIVDGLEVVDPVFNQSVVRGNVYNYLSDINVKDIETVTVLRDVSAAGIYGSRAANGAIVITTKEGTRKTFLDVSAQQGLSMRPKNIPVLNSEEYRSFLSDRLNNQGLSQSAINQRFPFFSNLSNTTAEYWRYANNTDWQKEVSRNAVSRDYYVNLRGGDATAKYSFNVGYNDEDGIGKGIDLSRFTLRSNLDFNISKKLSAGTRISFIRTQKNLMDQGYEERVNPLYLSLVKSPLMSPYKRSSEGVASIFYDQPASDGLSNPLAVAEGVSNEIKSSWILGSVFANYAITRTLGTKVSFGIDRRGLSEDRFTPSNGIVPVDFNPFYDRTSEEQTVNHQRIKMEHTFTFDKLFNQVNHLLVLGGYNVEMSDYKSNYGYSIHSTSDDFRGLGDGQAITMAGLREKYNNFSGFANANYNFRSKYLIKGGVRFDSSSKFGEDADGLNLFSAPFAVLPYAGLTWKLKGEKLFNNLSFLDEFNLRASWGLTANQDIPVNARHTVYTSRFFLNNPGFAPGTLGNNKVKWETTDSKNVGIDVSIFKNSLSLNVDFYKTSTTDLLMPQAVDGSTGYSYIWTNNGSIRNEGVEIGLNSIGNIGDFIWNIGLNLSKYNNVISDLPFGIPVMDGMYGYKSIAQEGSPAGLILGLKENGIYKTADEATSAGLSDYQGLPYQAGDFRFVDLNNDKVINDADWMVIGDSNPDLFGGITSNLSYKNFGIDAIFSFSYGNDILNVLRSKLETGAMYQNQSVKVLNRWMAEGDNTEVPYTRYASISNYQPSSYFIEDGSYLKMKSLSLTYKTKKQIAFARSAQLYVTGYNLFTLTKYLGWDPEVNAGQGVFSQGYDFGNYPQPKMFMVGIKIGL